MKKMTYSLSIFILILFQILQLHAQSPIIETSFPSYNQKNISILSNIIIKTNFRVDTSQFISQTPFYYTGDSSNFVKHIAQIILIKNDYLNSVPDSIQPYFGVSGDFIINNNDSIIFVLNSKYFEYETEYSLIIKNLKVLKPDTNQISGFDTLSIDTTLTHYFTTTEIPVYLESTSVDGRENSVLENESIILNFDKKIRPSDFTHLITTFTKIIDTVYVDSVSYYFIYDTLDVSKVISNDSLSITLTPDDSMEIGKAYSIFVDFINIYGYEYTVSREFSIKYLSRFRVIPEFSNVDSSNYGSDTTLKEICYIDVGKEELIFYPGDSISVSVPYYVDDYYFVGWKCEEDTTFFNSLDENNFTLYFNNNNLQDRQVFALYRVASIDTITIPESVTNGTIHIAGYKDSLGGGVYTYLAIPNILIEICVTPNVGYKFNYWESDETDYDNSQSPCLMVNLNPLSGLRWKDINLIPDFGGADVPNTDATYCIDVDYKQHYDWFKGDGFFNFVPNEGPQNIKDIINVFTIGESEIEFDNPEGHPYYENKCVTYNPQSFPYTKSITVAIKEDYKSLYEITDFICESNHIYPGDTPACSTITKEITVLGYRPYSASSSTNIVIKVRRITQKLIIERALIDGGSVPINLLKFNLDITNKHIDLNPKGPTLKDGEQNSYGGYIVDYAVNEYLIPKETVNTMDIMPTCEENSGYYLDSWASGSGYTSETIINPPEQGQRPQNGEMILRIVMDEDRTVRLLGDEGFRLNWIGYKKKINGNLVDMWLAANPARGTEKHERPNNYEGEFNDLMKKKTNNNYQSDDFFTPDYDKGFPLEWNGQEEIGWCPHLLQTKACELFFEFNRPVDPTSLKNSLSINDLKRFDNQDNQTIWLDYADNDNETFGKNFNAKLNSNSTILDLLLIKTFSNSELTIWTPHIATIQFNFENSTIMSQETQPENLLNASNNNIIRVTGLPGMKIYVTNFIHRFEETPINFYSYGSVFIHDDKAHPEIYWNYDELAWIKDEEGRYIYGANSFLIPERELEGETDYEMNKEIFYTPKLRENNNINITFDIVDKYSYGLTEAQASNLVLKFYKNNVLCRPKYEFADQAEEIENLGMKEYQGLELLKRNDKPEGVLSFWIGKKNVHVNDLNPALCRNWVFPSKTTKWTYPNKHNSEKLFWGVYSLYHDISFVPTYFKSCILIVRGCDKPIAEITIKIVLGNFSE